MATHKSAAKRARQAQKRRVRNAGVKTQVRRSVRVLRESIDSGDKATAQQEFKKASTQLRRAASKGVLHKRTVSRRVSRLSRAVNKLS